MDLSKSLDFQQLRVIFCKTQAVSGSCDTSSHRFFQTWQNERYL